MITTPDYVLAATSALRVLVFNHITETPVNPSPILLNYPGVRVLPYTKMALDAGIERHDLVPMFGNADAATFHLDLPGMDDVKYVVVYNMRLPFEIIWRACARELGHIVLGHTGHSRSMEARMAEANCFSIHLICPRPVLRMLADSGVPLTMNVLANTTGCSVECIEKMQSLPGIHVDPALNRAVRELFAPHITEFARFYQSSPGPDHSPVVDLCHYMDGYEEA